MRVQDYDLTMPVITIFLDFHIKLLYLIRSIDKLLNKVIMKVLSSLKSAKKRDKHCQIVKRKGRIYVINKKNPRFKAKQG